VQFLDDSVGVLVGGEQRDDVETLIEAGDCDRLDHAVEARRSMADDLDFTRCVFAHCHLL